ncbi:uncharacterized protein LOC125489951 [Plutella xylostella]|uniref:uncharacterized protein LOC125489951 n=1 Tax=Plutella xylostella TaxID=51655 RepID=UPI002032B7E1|nr:uncharacterized protein LOC125489951 [Plutella xylostella]
MEDKLKELLIKRSSIRGRVTKFKNSVDLLTTESISSIELSKLSMKITKFEALFNEFDELQGEIEILNELNLSSELATRDLIEQDFYQAIAVAQNIVQTKSPSKQEDNVSNPSCSANSQCHHQPDETLGFKLPIIKIPNFDGTYYKWMEFKETFTSLIHDNEKIKNIHKFHYLNSYLEGEASRVICNLEVNDLNYVKAWQLLCERFDNKRQLINNHLKSLLSFESVRETDKSLRFIIDHVSKNLRALSTLGLPTDKWDMLIIFMVSAKLDPSTFFKWEENRNTLPDIPTLEQFFQFLKNRADVLETVQRSRQHDRSKPNNNHNFNSQNRAQTKAMVVTSKEAPSSPPKFHFECVECKANHRLYECPTFKSKKPEERMSLVTALKLCTNCLRGGHNSRYCKLPGSCRLCKQKHNSLLHQSNEVSDSNQSSSLTMSAQSSTEVLLCTAMVKLINPATNQSIKVRALLDSGSQSSFITEAVKNKLSLTPQPSNTNIVGIGNTPINLKTERCALQLQSNDSSYDVKMTCLIMPKISDNLPKVAFDIRHLNLSDFSLADPSFNEPSPIEMLIGADLFWDIIGSQQHSLGEKNPILRSSKFGWLIAGPIITKTIPTKNNKNSNKNILCRSVGEECSDPSIKSIIQRDLYCDDLLTGADSEEQLRYIQRSVSSELAKGCFNLRKYRSNLTNLFSGNEELEKDNLLISNSTSSMDSQS